MWGGQGVLNLPLPVPFNPGSRPVFFGSRPFAFFRLRNIAQCCIIFPFFSRFPPPWESRFPPPLLPPPVHLPPPVPPHLNGKGRKRMLLKGGMGNGEWGMGNGEWGMGNGEWGMGNGEWGMENENGEWGMGNGEWGMVNGGQW